MSNYMYLQPSTKRDGYWIFRADGELVAVTTDEQTAIAACWLLNT